MNFSKLKTSYYFSSHQTLLNKIIHDSMRQAWTPILLWLGLLLVVRILPAQQLSPAIDSLTAIPTLSFAIPETAELLAEDKRLGLEARFARPIDINLNVHTAGSWQITNDFQIWQLKISVPRAQGIYIAFDQLELPLGAELAMYDELGNRIDQYKEEINNAKKKIMLYGGVGAEVLIKYKIEKNKSAKGNFKIFKIFHVYKLSEGQGETAQQAPILNCHLNAVCLGNEKMDKAGRGVLRILRYFEQGLAWCSGALINNVRMDQTPYVLTAFHCVDGLVPDYDLWRFDFNLASMDCEGELKGEEQRQLHGAYLRAGRRDSDFLLLELKNKIPEYFHPYFLGWNHSDQLPTKSFAFHHPKGALQKVAIDENPPALQSSTILWSNQISTPAEFHLVVEFDQGTQEMGSSGGPLLNDKGQIIGQLHGGNANCHRNKSYFGRFQKSWADGESNQERLDHWLDPDHTGIPELAGLLAAAPEFYLSGKVVNQYGGQMANINIALMVKDHKPVVRSTDENGNYYFSGLESEQDYSIRPVVSNEQSGEIIIKIRDGQREATFTPQKIALPISQQSNEGRQFLFDRIYPNQIDVEDMQSNLRQLDFTIIRN